MKPLISLDVFDTAIFRKVFYPTDIFNVVEDKVGNNFKALRLSAQTMAATKKRGTYSLIDIYKEMTYPFSPKEEIKAEYENCVANHYILDMYNKGEADYIFISDMYLPSTVIKSMLEKCGYKNPQVYVSCELKACKGNGLLFTKVEEVLKRKISKHIGDNYSADIVGAQKAGIPKVEFVGPPTYQNKNIITPLLESVKLRKLLIDKELSSAPIAEKIGYQFAPLILSFTQKVLSECTGNQTIFFNARDSFAMYVIARWILKTDKSIKYCRFSRKSCAVANILVNYAMRHPLNSFSLSVFKIQRLETLRDLINTFNFDENWDYLKDIKEYNITLDSDISLHPSKGTIIEKVIVSIQKDLYEKVKVERKNFVKYLQNLGIKNGDIFVDLGYNGTIQGMITRISGIKLRGRYINTFDLKGDFQGTPIERKSFLPIGVLKAFGGAALEVIFSESRGTVVGYTDEGLPKLNKDNKYRKEITKSILRGIIKGARDILREGIKVTPDDGLKVIARYVNVPTVEEASFVNQPIFENGSYERNENIVWYDQELIKQGKIRECFRRSYWKKAFRILLENDPKYRFLSEYIK